MVEQLILFAVAVSMLPLFSRSVAKQNVLLLAGVVLNVIVYGNLKSMLSPAFTAVWNVTLNLFTFWPWMFSVMGEPFRTSWNVSVSSVVIDAGPLFLIQNSGWKGSLGVTMEPLCGVTPNDPFQPE